MKLFHPKFLSEDQKQRLISERLRWILDACFPLRVILFGSALSADMSVNSDIDLIVIMNNDTDLKLTAQSVLSRKPPHETPADILFYTKSVFEERSARGGVCYDAAREGKVIYDAFGTRTDGMKGLA